VTAAADAGGAPPSAVDGDGPSEATLELAALQDDVRLLGRLVADALERAMDGLVHRNGDRLRAVIEADRDINERQRSERERCLVFIATHHPVHRELNGVVALMLMGSELERMGDHAMSCARLALPLIELSDRPHLEDISRLGRYVAEQVRDILAAFTDADTSRAQDIAARDDRIDRIYHRLFEDLMELMREQPDAVYAATNLLFIGHNLERIGDRVTNIAEDLVFLDSGRIVELG